MKGAAEELTFPKWARAFSKPPTCSLFLNKSKGYVRVLLIIPAPLPQIRLVTFPVKQGRHKKGLICLYEATTLWLTSLGCIWFWFLEGLKWGGFLQWLQKNVSMLFVFQVLELKRKINQSEHQFYLKKSNLNTNIFRGKKNKYYTHFKFPCFFY